MTPYFRFIIKYGVIIFIVISSYKLSELLFLDKTLSLDTYSFIIVVISIIIGFYFSYNHSKNEQIFQPTNTYHLKNNIEISKREMEVLELLSEGYTNNEISDILFISLNTTKTHLSNIYSKLGTNNRVQTIKVARNYGLIGD